ncbi:hypothetical protein BCR36DRAFT_408069 [Piromyces finnis]|uniref:Uncharacterized protein n=1 Tax=Piromyces finnis TaxID=1754191 RepID=A0A1Y1VNV5_9FUNG|nr:hypothetical protein BCR36DRAFT_408069 [Piromyces finnis]|eukprot:ORX61089.1 hypothetical protein BCR36DRAFT_408069 [Piromyces finnis]
MDNGKEGPLIKLFNFACHEAKSEFKQLIFFEQIQRFQIEKKSRGEDELKEKEKFLQDYFKNMKSEYETSQKQKDIIVGELNSYIRNIVKEELNKNQNGIDNHIKLEKKLQENLNTTNENNHDRLNYMEIEKIISELKNNQQKLINYVAALFNLKDEIYIDFKRIKDVLLNFQNRIRELESKKNTKAEDSIKFGTMDSETSNDMSIDIPNPINKNSNNEVSEKIKESIQNVSNRLQAIENMNLSDKINQLREDDKKKSKKSNKQLEEKIYEKIRQKQKEISEGFQNQDKKILNIDENYKRKFMDLENKCIKCNEQWELINNQINELTEKVAEAKRSSSSEEIKKLTEEVKKNKKKEDERITNVTNILNEKINKVDTLAEFNNNENIEIKKNYQKFESDIKTIQDKYNEIEHNIKSFSVVANDINDKYKELLSQNESTTMNLSILDSTVNSLTNNIKNYDLEKMKNNINVAKSDVRSLLSEHFPKYKIVFDTKFEEADKKLDKKIGEVYKSVNKNSQRIDILNKKVDDREDSNKKCMQNLKEGQISQMDYIGVFRDRFNKYINSPNNNNYVDDEIIKLKNYISSEIESIRKENEANLAVKEATASLNQYIDNEITKLKSLILSSTSLPISLNDPNYITLQTFLTNVLNIHWSKFEANWKKEFYQCVEKINSIKEKEK